MIHISELSKRYADTVVVDGVSLTIPSGGVTAIIGPNGAGKSSMLSMVSRLLPMSAGKVTVDGLDVTTSATARRWPGGFPSCARTIICRCA